MEQRSGIGSLRCRPILAHREVVLKELGSRTVFIVVKLVEQDDIGFTRKRSQQHSGLERWLS